MGLFDKKYCDICGDKIGLLGNRKLEDGNMCKDCAKKLSPFFEDRRSSTISEIKEQLAYREENKKAVAQFEPSLVLGTDTKVYVDEAKGKWLVSGSRSWRDENPDVMDVSQVMGCDIDIDEDAEELKRRNREGELVSYIPPRWEYYYDFKAIIHVKHRWFDEIKISLNGYHDIKGEDSPMYRETLKKANAIKTALTNARDDDRRAQAAAKAPKQNVICPACGASTIPDASGCCEYCGSPALR